MSIDVSQMSIDQLKELRARIDGIIDGPGDKMDSLDSAVAEMKAPRAKVASTGKAAVSKVLKAFFAKHPEVIGLRWRMYTPYFNDGDECRFRIGDLYVKVEGYDDEDGGDYDDGYTSPWFIGYGAEKAGKPKPDFLKSLDEDLSSLSDLFDESKDAMKAVFGDHVMITVGPDAEAQVEEYDHHR